MKAKILLLLATIIIFFAFSEIVIRIAAPQRGDRAERVSEMPKESIYYDNIFGIKLKPDFEGVSETPEFRMVFRTNSEGLRDDNYGAKEEGAYRIFCLGDSMTFGYGVAEDKTFARLLSKDLAGITDKKLEVINGGIPGYDIDRYGLVFKEIGLPYHPDLLITFFTITNDFGNELRKGKSVPIQGESRHFFSLRDVKKFFLAHSHLYAWIRNRLNSLSFLNVMLIKLSVREIGDIYLRDYSDTMRSKVERARNILKDIYGEARMNGCGMFVVAIPDSRQLSKGLRYNSSYWDMDKPNEVLKSILADIGIPYFDLLQIFKQENGEKFYYKVDGHLNSEGHSEVAKLVAAYIKDNRLIR